LGGEEVEAAAPRAIITEEVGEEQNLEMHTVGDISQELPPKWMDEEVEVDASLESRVELAVSQQRIEGEKPGSGHAEMTWSDVGGKKAVQTGPATRAATDRTHIPRPAAHAQARNKPELTECVTPEVKNNAWTKGWSQRRNGIFQRIKRHSRG
jgi:hypothetical protein